MVIQIISIDPEVSILMIWSILTARRAHTLYANDDLVFGNLVPGKTLKKVKSFLQNNLKAFYTLQILFMKQMKRKPF